ncbi:PHP domain-containing protein [Candidatus Bathyarchaeota archaeon]|nr:PHP domain-containing protein [Candidatus Bathyarchaeota archaeon]
MFSLKIDVHVHTAYSDGRGTVREILKIAKFKGLDGLAITDHDCLKGYFKAKLYSSGLLVIPGYEVHTDAGHVLVLGLELLPSETRRIRYEELVEWVRCMGGLTVLAHPAAGRIKLNRWIRCKPDAVEILNALYPLHGYFVHRGLNVASKLGVPTVGGSDAHYPQNVGDAYTIVESDNPSLKDFMEYFRRGSVYFGGRLSPLSSRLKVGLGYIISMVGGYVEKH